MAFNKEQAEAIYAPIDKDIVISAGAGSGKTKTLAERVFHIISEGMVSPSELLVLTFTNNAAHEMKSRIIARFATDSDPTKKALANSMLSAHVQTFDSFNQYLVSRYASRLGLSSNLSILDETELEAQKHHCIEEVFEEYYSDDEKRARFVSTLKKFTIKNDETFSKLILDLYKIIESLDSSEKKEKFYSEYAGRYFSDEFALSCMHDYLDDIRENTKNLLIKAYFVQTNYDVLYSDEPDYEALEKIFSKDSLFCIDYHCLNFEDKACAQPIYEACVDLIDSSDSEMIEKAIKWRDAIKPFSKATKLVGVSKEDKDRINAPLKIFKNGLINKTGLLFDGIVNSKGFEHEKEKINSFRPDIELCFEILKKFDSKLEEYKRKTNSFTFSDIGTLAIRLLTEDQFSDIAEETRNQFTYIMVDEYQDTNDPQEAFLNSLTKIKKDGTRAHLFCVGDAKQSIYAFRGSNVQLFRNRQVKYSDGKEGKVIGMNKNYRSGPGLLSDFNYICQYYMRLDHGSIDFGDPMEKLSYDKEVNLYSEPYEHFHVSRLMSDYDPARKKEGYVNKKEAEKEAKMIADDIRDKVNEGYLVYDKSSKPKIRKCKYGDFAILLRTKKCYKIYEDTFDSMNIPFNEKESENLNEIRSILYLQSLVSFLNYLVNGIGNPTHLFASIARSYAFNYSDDKLYKILSYKDADAENTKGLDNLKLAKEDDIWKSFTAFVENNKDLPFHLVFLNLVKEFKVIEALPNTRDVDANISKIESLYSLAYNNESRGQGLKEFVELFESVKKNDLDLASETNVQTENAVDLMTIHASKGLERKIVYFPSSGNLMSKGSSLTKPIFEYSEKYGIQFPYYTFEPNGINVDPETSFKESVDTLARNAIKITKSNDAEIDEHVRLFYVALTRAENEFIIVGNDIYQSKTEDPYAMLYSCPNSLKFDDDFLSCAYRFNIFSKTDVDSYYRIADILTKNRSFREHPDLSKKQKENYDNLKEEFLIGKLQRGVDEALEKIYQSIYKYSLGVLNNRDESCDLIADVYSLWKDPANFDFRIDKGINGVLVNAKMKNERFIDPESYGQGEDDESESWRFDSADEAKKYLTSFLKALTEKDTSFFSTNKTGTLPAGVSLENMFVGIFALVVLGHRHFVYPSFKTSEYDDPVRFKSLNLNQVLENDTKLNLPELKVDESEIHFDIKQQKRASKNIVENDPITVSKLEYGIKLHAYMEQIDFSNPDLSFIEDFKERALIANVLELDPLKNAKGAEMYTEYGFYDLEAETTGYIDLLYFKNGIYTIVDYKTSDIDDHDYVNQLRVYARNVARLFGCEESKIKLYLISLEQCKYKEVL